MPDVKEFYSDWGNRKKQEHASLIGVELQGMDNFEHDHGVGEPTASATGPAGGTTSGALAKAGEMRHQDLVGSGKLERK